MELSALLHSLRAEGKRILGYGAAAKGAIMLNYTGIGPDLLTASSIATCTSRACSSRACAYRSAPPPRSSTEMPDYLLLLPWNFKQEIMPQQAEYQAAAAGSSSRFPEPVIA